ncbi:MAG: tetratricopeptide repeat protein, partial [Deltaproteobacteria bacterium]|nr:tetratricopeptide repeat protein [Deltaproteobacteria bacterium]
LGVNPASPGANVVLGKLSLAEGQPGKAQKSFELAAKTENAPSWVLAEAYGGLGRISAFQKDPKSAMTSYDKSLGYEPEQPTVAANKAVLLEREGKYEEAAKLYEKAAAANPQDKMTAQLWQNARHRVDVTRDQEKQKKIDQLVEELLKRQKDQGPAAAKGAADQDRWRSRPLTLCELGFEFRGGLPSRDGLGEYLNLLLAQKLDQSPRIKVVDRALMDKLLEELKLGSSALADPNAALKLGRILAARLLLSGQILAFRNQCIANVRLIDVETSGINGALQQTLTGEDLVPQVEALAQGVEQAVAKHYPVRGRVSAVKGEVVELNIGSAVGVAPGVSFDLFDESGLNPVGELIISQVQERTSQAKALKTGKEIKAGMKVELNPSAGPGKV